MRKRIPDVLVLNKSWCPVQIVNWQVCMSKIYQGIAHPLDREFIAYTYKDWLTFSEISETYPVIHTVNHRIAIPEIIALVNYNRLPIRDVKYSRQSIFQRDKNLCGYCGNRFKSEDLTIDHIIPRCKGGKTTWDNTISCCRPCNSRKDNKLLHEAGLKLLFKPKKPTWISPVANIRPDHPCKSWLKFMNRVSTDENN